MVHLFLFFFCSMEGANIGNEAGKEKYANLVYIVFLICSLLEPLIGVLLCVKIPESVKRVERQDHLRMNVAPVIKQSSFYLFVSFVYMSLPIFNSSS